jgi:hypothetical protein
MNAEDGNPLVEAAIYEAPTGRYAGKFVARCANDECGYLGK